MSKTPKKTEPSKSNSGVEVTGSPEKGQTVSMKNESALCKIFNTHDQAQAEAFLMHCFKALKSNEASDEFAGNDERTFMLSIIRDLKPRDAIERMLAVQMAVTHVATIRSGRWLAHTESIPQVQAHYTGFNKLSRTFAAQVEALRKYRNGGEQKVTVQHVNVSEGGQAIVGNVKAGGRGKSTCD